MQISLTADKAQKIKKMCQELLANPRPSIRDVARALGTFTASLPGVMYIRMERLDIKTYHI
jgi:endonuclease III